MDKHNLFNMENKERETKVGLVKDISKKYLEYREVMIGGDKSSMESIKDSIVRDSKVILSMYTPKLNASEDGYFTGEFLYRFCNRFLNQEQLDEIQINLKKGREKYTMSKDLVNQIESFNVSAFEFLSSKYTSGTKKVEIPKLENPITDIIFETHVNESILNQRLKDKIGEVQRPDQISLTQKTDCFEVTFQK